MMSFWRKNKDEHLNSNEYESISKKVTELFTELEELKIKFKILETNYDNLRGNFNRKLTGIKKEEETEKATETQNINNPVILPDNGNPFKRW